MAEEDKPQAPPKEPQEQPSSTTPSAGTQNTDTPVEPTIPYARFKEVNDKLKSIESQMAQQARESQAAEEKRLADQAKWQELADTRKVQLEELEPKVKLAEQLTAMVTEQYQAEIKEWPEQVKKMAPADDASILVKLDWMGKAKPLALELMGEKPSPPGNGHRPPPLSPSGASKASEAQKRSIDQRAARVYK